MPCPWTLAAIVLALTLAGSAFAQSGSPSAPPGPAFAQTGGGDRVSSLPFATRSEVIARHGMAATSQPLATQIAIDILKRGGSAVDAAIAANAALGLMEPTGNGLGGDLFAIVWDAKTQKLYGLNASGRSPYGLTRQFLIDNGHQKIPSHGPLPVSVPGCVDGWFELHQRFGKLQMSDVLAPAIGYAREGFPVSELIAYYWAAGQKLAEQPGFAETFLPGGQAPRKGEIFRNPMLADTLERIAAGGRDAFYEGEIAERIDAFCRRVGCFIRKRDLAEHTSTWVEPLSTSYRGFDVWELPPNGQGIAALQMLNILEGYDLKSLGHNSAAYLHLCVEAKKLAFEDRARWYADPDFAQAPLATLLSKDYAAQRRKLIDTGRAARRVPFGAIDAQRGAGILPAVIDAAAGVRPGLDIALADADARLRDGDTIYLCVADADRNMVSLIQSNYRGFGSGLCPDGLGFCLQDRGELFTLEQGHPNVYEPHKRPFHTIIPAFVTKDGRPLMAFGVMGGDMQPQGHVQIICNLIDFGMNLQEAGDAARWYHTGSSEPTGRVLAAASDPATARQGSGPATRPGDERLAEAAPQAPTAAGDADALAALARQFPDVMFDGGRLSLESGIAADVRAALERLGHRLKYEKGAFGGYQGIWFDAVNDVYVGASESRKDGCAMGY